MKKFISIIILFSILCFLLSCSSTNTSNIGTPSNANDGRFTYSFDAFDTSCTISLYGKNIKTDGERIATELSYIISGYEKTFSKTAVNSDIYNINHRSIDSVKVNDMTTTIFDVARAMHSWTNGAFDISAGTLIDLWDVKNRKTVPSLEEINEARKHCNNFNYDIDIDSESEDLLSNTITFHGDNATQYDIGALAKGYCTDSLKQYLLGVDNIDAAIINLGGNVCCIGEIDGRKDGAFNVGIFKPFSQSEIIDTIKVKNRCVITSGIYQRYFTIDGDNTIYHHIIDPRTGYPVDNGLSSVTIVSENGLLGDFLSTACMLLGVKESMKLIDFCKKSFGDKNIQAIFVDRNNKVTKYPEKVKIY